MANERSRSFLKILIFSIIPLLILILILELGFRFYFYQKEGQYDLAVVELYDRGKFGLLKLLAKKKVADLAIPPGLEEALYSEEGEPLFEEFKILYEKYFKLLVTATKKIDSKFVVLYIPSDNYRTKSFNKKTRKFFRELTQKYGIEFLDTTDEFMKWPTDIPTLRPENGHLSRFGNKLVVENLAEVLQKYDDYRSSFHFSERPKLFGDLVPNEKKYWRLWEAKPFRATTSSQGLRLKYNLTFPKEKQRVLILGDSFTYGPYLGDHETYPALLDTKFPEREVINAGVLGYTIPDEADLFVDRAKYVEPDITILQVLDNDIYGLFFFKRNEFSRNKYLRGRLDGITPMSARREIFPPSELELKFIESMRKKQLHEEEETGRSLEAGEQIFLKGSIIN
jgi:lysophospholipase L1-like esterase